jgi:hypothetical protein
MYPVVGSMVGSGIFVVGAFVGGVEGRGVASVVVKRAVRRERWERRIAVVVVVMVASVSTRVCWEKWEVSGRL